MHERDVHKWINEGTFVCNLFVNNCMNPRFSLNKCYILKISCILGTKNELNLHLFAIGHFHFIMCTWKKAFKISFWTKIKKSKKINLVNLVSNYKLFVSKTNLMRWVILNCTVYDFLTVLMMVGGGCVWLLLPPEILSDQLIGSHPPPPPPPPNPICNIYILCTSIHKSLGNSCTVALCGGISVCI